MSRLGVWDVVELTPAIKTVGTTWVFCVKHSPPNGDPEFKAQLCAQGFSQTHGVDYSKTFSPTGRLNSLCALISHAAINNFKFDQLDVKLLSSMPTLKSLFISPSHKGSTKIESASACT